MKLLFLLVALLVTSATALSGTVATVRTPMTTYVLTWGSDAPDPSDPSAVRKYVLKAVRTSDQKRLWTVAVEPEARNLYLQGSVLLTYSCFSGAYLHCQIQAFSTRNGRQLWQESGHLWKTNKDFVLLQDDFFFRDDSPNLYLELHVVRLPGGIRKAYTLQVPPRDNCEGSVQLLNVLKFSTSSLATLLQDGCGTYTRTFR